MCLVQTLGNFDVNCLPRLYESELHGQKKIRRTIACVSKTQTAKTSDTENRRIGKIDNVKSSPERQVKARPLFTIAGYGLALLYCSARDVIAAKMSILSFVNGNIYTVNEHQPHAEAIAVKNDRIVFVGSNADAKKLQTARTRIVDLRGSTVVPGLTDSHCHIFGIGERELTLNLEGTNSLEDFLAKVKERVDKTGARQMDHRPRLDRNFLEAAAIPDPRRSRQDRAGQSGFSQACRWSRVHCQ